LVKTLLFKIGLGSYFAKKIKHSFENKRGAKILCSEKKLEEQMMA
jgi:hypothetical protein